jgi:hypothetical protein
MSLCSVILNLNVKIIFVAAQALPEARFQLAFFPFALQHKLFAALLAANFHFGPAPIHSASCTTLDIVP